MGPANTPLSNSGESNNIQRFCSIDEEGKSLMRGGRAPDGLERTIADLAGEEAILTQYLAVVFQLDENSRTIPALFPSSSHPICYHTRATGARAIHC